MPASSEVPTISRRARRSKSCSKIRTPSGGLILLSKRKADTIRGWEHIINTKKEGRRRQRQGHSADQGRSARRHRRARVFLPASQVDIRKPGDISRFIGKEVECKVLKIDVENRNIVVSRGVSLSKRSGRASKEKDPHRDRGRAASQGCGQEHRRLRRLRRPGRLGRSAAHLGPELGPDFASVGGGRSSTRISRCVVIGVDKEQREDLAGPQAEDRQPVGRASKRSTLSGQQGPGHGRQRDELRRVRPPGRWNRRSWSTSAR